MRTSVLFGAKNFGFFEIYGVSAWSREVEQVWTFFEKGVGVVFRDFVRASFIDGPLSNTYLAYIQNKSFHIIIIMIVLIL